MAGHGDAFADRPYAAERDRHATTFRQWCEDTLKPAVQAA
jgi:hypothetical protein